MFDKLLRDEVEGIILKEIGQDPGSVKKRVAMKLVLAEQALTAHLENDIPTSVNNIAAKESRVAFLRGKIAAYTWVLSELNKE